MGLTASQVKIFLALWLFHISGLRTADIQETRFLPWPLESVWKFQRTVFQKKTFFLVSFVRSIFILLLLFSSFSISLSLSLSLTHTHTLTHSTTRSHNHIFCSLHASSHTRACTQPRKPNGSIFPKKLQLKHFRPLGSKTKWQSLEASIAVENKACGLWMVTLASSLYVWLTVEL